MNKKQKINLHKEMKDEIISKMESNLEDLIILVNIYCKQEEIDFDGMRKDIITLFYISLAQTYKSTLSFGRKIYPCLDFFNPKTKISNKTIDKYTYSEDNLSLIDRIMKHIDAFEKGQITKLTLIYYLGRLLKNETLILHRKLLKEKLKEKKVEYGIVVPGEGCDRECCNGTWGEAIPIDEVVEPPYHPNCTCEVIYVDPESDDEEE